MPQADSLAARIKKTAIDIGFSTVGIAPLAPCKESERIFDKWLRDQKHGDMRFLAGWKERRKNPRLLLSGARSAICVGLNYYSDSLIAKKKNDGREARGVFSIYSHGRDYHSLMGEMLSSLADELRKWLPSIKTVSCVDTKPVSDRTLAVLSGIAWLGKNANVISPEFGSWIFLGSLLTDAELPADAPLESRCGDCTICIDACPAGAIEEGFVIDARKCISYLTVEKRGEIAPEMHESIGINVFGCDKCQLVCPYNDVAKRSTAFPADSVNPLVDMKLSDLMNIDEGLFDEYTRDSAIRRCGLDGLRRNARIAFDNIVRDSAR
jgi:epoxyqueuosine reductase